MTTRPKRTANLFRMRTSRCVANAQLKTPWNEHLQKRTGGGPHYVTERCADSKCGDQSNSLTAAAELVYKGPSGRPEHTASL